MSNYDSDILIQNIKKLMDDNDITQVALAEVLDMSQPNVSKALSNTDKKNFTLDQLVGIAKHFHVSLDMLVGNNEAVEHSISQRAIAEYFVRLIEHEDIKVVKHPIEENIYDSDYDFEKLEPVCKNYKKTIEYNAFYFPMYWQIPDGLDCEEKSIRREEIKYFGNETSHKQTNKFFHQFLQIYNLYKQKALEEDTYRTVVADLLSHLHE